MKKLRSIKTQNIIYCRANGCYTELILIDSRKVIISKHLKKVEEFLFQINRNFIRNHDSFLVNKTHIKMLYIGEKCSVQMSNDDNIAVTARKRSNILMLLHNTY